jgi:hypothetical protein
MRPLLFDFAPIRFDLIRSGSAHINWCASLAARALKDRRPAAAGRAVSAAIN